MLRMMRPTPRIGDSGGSSGCIESLTPAFSATGSTLRRKYSRFSQSSSSLIGGFGGDGLGHVVESKLVTTEPPREGVAMLVRSQLKSVIHS